MWLKFFKLTLQCSLCAVSPKHLTSRAHVVFRTLLDWPLISSSQSTPTSSSLLFPSHWPTTSTPQTGLLFGRFAEQSPLTGYEPSAPIEVSSTEATPSILLLSRKGSLGSTHNSGDDLATTAAALEVGERSDLGMLAPPLFSQKRETSPNPFGIYHLIEKVLKRFFHTFVPARRNPMSKQEKIESRLRCCARFSSTKSQGKEMYSMFLKCKLISSSNKIV